ncbi:uncharacterized protein BDR25DRAFT_90214 [Lindgomyces ingoldianus]|uniref:Uncharacterized protein n=1 Tax=Lindgomyces ingoldianus TaxID=673940 RepID=A0ACB6RCK4_9PLEO|nr:uncharacterized protein BDR25DRAFT_90214 [Lindgomyces ingoldianus]KAF2476060.1 hypothetical protein BDR25DRAFT_90214 [Lindgomyces ingoldianus]
MHWETSFKLQISCVRNVHQECKRTSTLERSATHSCNCYLGITERKEPQLLNRYAWFSSLFPSVFISHIYGLFRRRTCQIAACGNIRTKSCSTVLRHTRVHNAEETLTQDKSAPPQLLTDCPLSNFVYQLLRHPQQF